MGAVYIITLALVLDFHSTEELPLDVGFRYDPGFAVLTGVLSLAYPAVGALIASRLPANPIGWIFCGTGLIYAMRRSTTAYADYAFIEPSALALGRGLGMVIDVVGFSAGPALECSFSCCFPKVGRLLVGGGSCGG